MPGVGTVVGSLGAETIPEDYADRRPNRGFEAVALDEENGVIYAFIQTPLANPDRATSDGSDVIRIIGLDTTTGERDSLNELAEKIGRPVDPQIGFFARLRFIGQEHTLAVPWAAADTAEGLFARFSQAHANRFGHTFDSEAEIVSLDAFRKKS